MLLDENTPDLVQDDNENQDAPEVAEETNEEDSTDWKAEALKYKAILDRNNKKKTEKVEHTEEKKTDDFGYDVKAYLKASGIKATEFDFVKAELKAFGGGDIDSLLDNEYFQSKLEKSRALQQTADATPKGKRSSGVPTDSVDYWLSKPFEDVPVDMRAKVVNARLSKENSKGIFYNS